MQVFDLVDVVELSKHRCSHPIDAKLKYATSKNAVGHLTHGYISELSHIALLGRETAEKLCEVQNYLNDHYGLGLFIYDAYRPKTAITHFLLNSSNDLLELSYVAEEAGYCYGNTIDLILKDLKTNRKLCTGTRFDFAGEIFHTTMGDNEISEEAFYHRKTLGDAMLKFGFNPDKEDCWHFRNKDKTKKPFDIPITPEIVEKVKKLSI